MPAHVEKRNGRFRIVEPSRRLVRNRSGTPVDGGGHLSKNGAIKQVFAINRRPRRRRR